MSEEDIAKVKCDHDSGFFSMPSETRDGSSWLTRSERHLESVLEEPVLKQNWFDKLQAQIQPKIKRNTQFRNNFDIQNT